MSPINLKKWKNGADWRIPTTFYINVVVASAIYVDDVLVSVNYYVFYVLLSVNYIQIITSHYSLFKLGILSMQ
jgi:hypothetical protein